MTKIEDFDREKSSNDIINNATISDEVVASYGPRGPCSRREKKQNKTRFDVKVVDKIDWK